MAKKLMRFNFLKKKKKMIDSGFLLKDLIKKQKKKFVEVIV